MSTKTKFIYDLKNYLDSVDDTVVQKVPELQHIKKELDALLMSRYPKDTSKFDFCLVSYNSDQTVNQDAF